MFFLLTSLCVSAWGRGHEDHNSYRKRFWFVLKVAEDVLLSDIVVRYFLHDYHLRLGALSGKKSHLSPKWGCSGDSRLQCRTGQEAGRVSSFDSEKTQRYHRCDIGTTLLLVSETGPVRVESFRETQTHWCQPHWPSVFIIYFIHGRNDEQG